jgi:NADPH:quinone reductase
MAPQPSGQEPARMTEAVRKAMRALVDRRVLAQVRPTSDVDNTRARAGDRGPMEGADDLHLRERGVSSPSPGGRGRRRRDPADGQPARASAHARRGGNRSVAGPRRPTERIGNDDEQSPPAPGEIIVRVQACGPNHVDHALDTELSGHGAPCIRGTDAAGTVIAAGDRVTRFAVGDEVFGHFPAEDWAWVEAACARTTADGPHVERRPNGLDPLAAAALADGGLTAKTILRAAGVRPGQTALVIGATSRAGTVLVPLLAEAGVHVIAGTRPDDDDRVRSLGATETVECATADPVADALAAHPEVDLLVDLVSFGEPYFITAGARHGTIITARHGAREPGLPRIGISALPGDLAALARRALGRDPHQLPVRSGGTVLAGLDEVTEQPAAATLDAAA